MPDNPTKKKADRKRVALKTQPWERDYLLDKLEDAERLMTAALIEITGARNRLRAGYPEKRAARKRGKP